MDPRIDDMIAMIGGASKTISTPAAKKVVADAAHSGVWVNWTPSHVRRTGRDGITPGNTGMPVSSKRSPSPILIGSTTIYPACVISGRLKVGNKRQSTSPDEVRNAQNVDTVVDGKLPNNRDYASVFGKVIGCKLSHGSIDDLYPRYRMNFLKKNPNQGTTVRGFGAPVHQHIK